MKNDLPVIGKEGLRSGSDIEERRQREKNCDMFFLPGHNVSTHGSF